MRSDLGRSNLARPRGATAGRICGTGAEHARARSALVLQPGLLRSGCAPKRGLDGAGGRYAACGVATGRNRSVEQGGGAAASAGRTQRGRPERLENDGYVARRGKGEGRRRLRWDTDDDVC